MHNYNAIAMTAFDYTTKRIGWEIQKSCDARARVYHEYYNL